MKTIKHLKLIVWAMLPFLLFSAARAQTIVLAREERWREDVRYYASELPKRHKNLFFQLSKDEFEREVRKLEAEITKLSDGEITLELMRITARIGDGHTSVSLPAAEATYFPFRLEQFKEGWFVTQAPDEYQNTLGGRLIKIGNVKIEKAEQLLRDLIAADNDIDRQSRLRIFFVSAEVLKAKGILPNTEENDFTFQMPDGKQLSIAARPLSLEQFLKVQLRTLSDIGKTPITARNAKTNYRFEYLPDSKTLYLAYNKCAEMPNEPFSDFVRKVFAVADEQPTEKLVIDLRRNGGGNSAVIESLYAEMEKRPQLIKKGKLFVLVSGNTFSSAFMNALEMRDRYGALWVGTPPGQRPNAYGEVKQFALPHSKINVQYSTKFWELMKGSDLPFAPVDVQIQTTFAEYAKGRDAILLAALNYRNFQ